MLHRVVGGAARLGPVLVDLRTRQGDGDAGQGRIGRKLTIEGQDRDALAGERLLFGLEQAAAGKAEQSEQQRFREAAVQWSGTPYPRREHLVVIPAPGSALRAARGQAPAEIHFGRGYRLSPV